MQMALFINFYSWVAVHHMYVHIFFICPAVDGHFDSFYVLAAVNSAATMSSAAMNIGVYISFWIIALNFFFFLKKVFILIGG